MQALIQSSPALQEYLAHLLASVEDRLAQTIAAERDLPPDSIQAHLIAAVCRTLVSYTMTHGSTEHVGEVALQFLEAGLAATTPR